MTTKAYLLTLSILVRAILAQNLGALKTIVAELVRPVKWVGFYEK
jgi:hypothetical protein